jgi:hypothetical protein
MPEPNGAARDIAERVQAIEDLVRDVKKWAVIVGGVIVAAFGMNLFQILVRVPQIASETATKIANEKAEQITSKEFQAQMDDYKTRARDSAAGAKISADDAAASKARIVSVLENLERGNLHVEQKTVPLDLAHSLALDFDVPFSFEVKHCWATFANNDDFGHRVQFTLTPNGKKVRVKTSATTSESESNWRSLFNSAKEYAAKAALPPKITLIVSASSF